MRQRSKIKTVKHKRSDLPPLPPDVPPELENEYREWQRQLDDYIAQWKAEMGKFLESKGYKRKAGGKPQRPTKLKKGTP